MKNEGEEEANKFTYLYTLDCVVDTVMLIQNKALQMW